MPLKVGFRGKLLTNDLAPVFPNIAKIKIKNG
jgi:hypothetical protein